MKRLLDLAIFLLGVFVITIALFAVAARPHVTVLKMELRDLQPPGTQGT